MTKDENNLELRGAIVRTLAFFDIFARPLTALEAWRYLPVKATVGEVRAALNSTPFYPGRVSEEQGFYSLPGAAASAKARHAEYLIATGKYRVALRAARLLRFVRGVRLVAACNNFHYKADSDIDVFIVTEGGRLWLTRALCTLVLQFARLRRHGARVKDRVCLSFYVSEDGQDLSGVTLPDDPYFYHWLGQMAPVYDIGGAYEGLWRANAWLAAKFPNIEAQAPTIRRSVSDNLFSRIAKVNQGLFLKGRLGDLLERLARGWQLKKMARNAKSAAPAHDTRVVISDTMLKFHENDRRKHYRQQYLGRLRDIGISTD